MALLGAVLVGISLVGTGCGGSSSTHSSSAPVRRSPPTPTTPAERAKFVQPAGLAFGTFHRYVYGPYKAGSLASAKRDRQALIKAGAAAALSAHEVALAKQQAAVSTSLRKLYGPLAALQPTLATLSSKLDHGQPDPADIEAANGGVASLERIGSATGVKIQEQATPSNP